MVKRTVKTTPMSSTVPTVNHHATRLNSDAPTETASLSSLLVLVVQSVVTAQMNLIVKTITLPAGVM